MSDWSDAWCAWIDEPLELGFGCFSDGDHQPFIMLQFDDGSRKLLELKNAEGQINEELIEVGRQLIGELSQVQAYALVFDGYLTGKGDQKIDAMFVEAGIAGEACGWLIAQPYRTKARGSGLKKIGEPVIVGEAPLRTGTSQQQRRKPRAATRSPRKKPRRER